MDYVFSIQKTDQKNSKLYSMNEMLRKIASILIHNTSCFYSITLERPQNYIWKRTPSHSPAQWVELEVKTVVSEDLDTAQPGGP